MSVTLSPQSWLVRVGAPIIVAAFGLGGVGLGGGRIYMNGRYRQTGKRATATVTYSTTRSAPNSTMSSAQYRFRTDEGRDVVGRQSGYYLRIGETVTVEYLSEAPDWNRVAGSGRLREAWNIPLVLVGSLFFLAGVFSLIRGRSTRDRPGP